MNNENSFVDLIKFIGSIMIFVMHLGVFGNIWEYLSRWAVPFFFIISSYYFFKSGKNIKLFLKRLIVLYLVWFIINIPSIFVIRIYANGVSKLKSYLLFLRELLLSSTFTGSWYLLALGVGTLFIYQLGKKMKTNTCIFITFFVQVICILSSAYANILPYYLLYILNVICFPLNIFAGMFFVSLGKYLAEHDINHKHYYADILCVLISLLLFIIEIWITKKYNLGISTDCMFSLIPLSFFIAKLAIRTKIKFAFSRKLRKMSTIIFCGQSNVLVFVTIMSKLISNITPYIKLIIGLVSMLCLILIVFYIQKKKVKFSNYLT